MDRFINLPTELLQDIFSYLQKSDLACLSRLNKDWNELTRYLLYHHVKLKWKGIQSSKNFNLTESLHIHMGEENTIQKDFNYQVPISWCGLKDAYAKIINYCDPDKLTLLSLHDCGITDKMMKSTLIKFNNLQTICLSHCPSVGRYSWLALRKLSSLKRLSICGTSMTDKYLRDILKDRKLIELEIGYPNKLLPGSFRWVTDELQLKTLKYHRVFICINSLHQIDRLINLEKLDLEGSFIGDDVFKKVCSNLLKLTSLNVSHCQLYGQCMDNIEDLKRLRDLNLHGNNITDASLPYIAKCTSLVHLNLSFNRLITDKGIHFLTSLEKLSTLELSMNSELTDYSLKSICEMKQLLKLDVSNCVKITYRGIHHISSLPLLTHLNLNGCESLKRDCMQFVTKLVKLIVFYPYCSLDNFIITDLDPSIKVISTRNDKWF